MTNIKFNPSEFYRKQRPGNFSDSFEKRENTLTSELFDFELSKITTNQKHDMFEDLCVEMGGLLISPNLIPQTGPTGGGDGKTDGETYPVSEEISNKWYIPKNGWDKNEKWAFAVSAKEQWKPKLKSDVKKIVGTGRGYTKVFFFTNQMVSSKKKTDAQDQYQKDFEIEITILDGKWISKNIFSKNLINLAVKVLNLDESYKVSHVLGQNDFERKEILEDLEFKIKNPNRYTDYDYQIVIDSINSANISRHLELPKDDTIGKYERAKKLNEKFGSLKLDIQISYQTAWTYYMYFSDYEGFIEEYNNFVKLVHKDSYDINDMEFYSTLIQLLMTLSKQVDISKSNLKISEIEADYLKALLYFIDNEEKNTSYFIAKGHKLLYLITQAIFENKETNKFLKELNEVLKESQYFIKFPFTLFTTQIELLGNILIDSKEYDELIYTIAEIDSSRNSQIASGTVVLERGMQKIKGEKNKEGVIFLGKSIRKLAKEESQNELYFAYISLSIGYRGLGLYWAQYNSLLSALHIKMQGVFEGGEINESIIFLLKKIIEFEITMGRIPSLLTWYELYLILSSQTDCETKEIREKYIQKIDAFVSVMITNIDFDKLKLAPKLHEILDDLGLEISKDTVLYLLKGEKSLDSEFIKGVGGVSKVNDFFTSILNQPLKNQFLGPIDLFNKEKEHIFHTKILGSKVKVIFQDNTLYTESFICYIECFLATSFNISSTVKDITINLIFSDKIDTYKINPILNHHIYDINLNLDFTDLNDTFFKAFTYILSNSFIGISEEILLELFQSDEVYERVLLISSHQNIFKNITGGIQKFELEKWEKSSYKDIEITNSISPLGDEKANIAESNNSLERHDNREIQSIINIPLWNKAKWNSFGFVTQNPKKEFGIFLFFSNKNAGRKIIEEIREKIGPTDKDELIRLSIIKGIDSKNKFHYKVHICGDIKKEQFKGGLVVSVSRFHTMTPDNDVNINNIEGLYKTLKKYTLYFGYSDIENGKQEIFLDLGIEKKVLHIRELKDIGKDDIDSMALKQL